MHSNQCIIIMTYLSLVRIGQVYHTVMTMVISILYQSVHSIVSLAWPFLYSSSDIVFVQVVLHQVSIESCVQYAIREVIQVVSHLEIHPCTHQLNLITDYYLSCLFRDLATL